MSKGGEYKVIEIESWSDDAMVFRFIDLGEYFIVPSFTPSKSIALHWKDILDQFRIDNPECEYYYGVRIHCDKENKVGIAILPKPFEE